MLGKKRNQVGGGGGDESPDGVISWELAGRARDAVNGCREYKVGGWVGSARRLLVGWVGSLLGSRV
jgi:hypothetical protein